MVDTRLNFHPKRKQIVSLLYAVAALILAALVLDGVFGPHGVIATYRLRLQVQQIQQKTQQLERENQEFANQVQQLKSDPSAIERVARERMGLVKPGELVFKLPPKHPSGPDVSHSGRTSPAAPSGSSAPGQ